MVFLAVTSCNLK